MTPRPTIVIVGPTAGGKSALAMHLAQRLPGGGTCIGADSMQVYVGMDIGTAKPSAADRRLVPHELLDVADPSQGGFTVDRWLDLAREAEDRTRASGRWPILVGGTNLYVKAFLQGLFEGPPPDPALRASLEALTPEALRAELERCDPSAAARIHRNDRRRTIRALEVFRATGRPISALQTQWREGVAEVEPVSAGQPSSPLDVRLVGLDFPVEAINRRINARVKAMFKQGLLEEVRSLHHAGRLGPQAAAAVGYKELVDHLEGRITLEEAEEAIKIASRRFAKQQRTWLRRFRTLPRSRWFDGQDPGLHEAVEHWLLEMPPETA